SADTFEHVGVIEAHALLDIRARRLDVALAPPVHRRQIEIDADRLATRPALRPRRGERRRPAEVLAHRDRFALAISRVEATERIGVGGWILDRRLVELVPIGIGRDGAPRASFGRGTSAAGPCADRHRTSGLRGPEASHPTAARATPARTVSRPLSRSRA